MTDRPCNSWMEKDRTRKAALRRMERLQLRFGVQDNSVAGWAADNLISGRPAFWYSAGTGFYAVSASNFHGDLMKGLTDYNWRRLGDERAEKWLDALIPLNEAAARQLLDAYRVLGTFRDIADLLARDPFPVKSKVPA